VSFDFEAVRRIAYGIRRAAPTSSRQWIGSIFVPEFPIFPEISLIIRRVL